MSIVQERIKSDYEAFINETDKNTKEELKKAYSDKILDLTIHSAKYKAVKKNFIKNLSAVNQQALNVINNETASIYAENYNQVAVECRRVGIRVIK